MNKLLYIFLLIFFFNTYNCLSQNDNKKNNDTTEIIIFHVNDVHAKIDNFAKLAYVVNSEKKNHKNVLLVSAGDLFSGNALVDKYKDKGYPIIDLMNKTGFNLSEFGNHEFDYGQQILSKRIKQADFKIICANLKVYNSILKQPEPYSIIQIDSITKIAFLGLIQTSDNGLPETHPDNIKGIDFYNGIEKAKDYKFLKNDNNIFIVLSHLGYKHDSILATKMPDIDAIIGGHSHKLIDKQFLVNGVLITQAGNYLNYVGKLTFKIYKGKIIEKKDTLINLNNVTESDENVQKIVNKYKNNKKLTEIIGFAQEKFDENALGNLITDAIRYETKTDITFQNLKGIRINALNKGNIIISRIYELDPFSNKVVKFQLNTDEIKSLILASYKLFDSVELAVSGINYEVILDKNKKITDVKLYDYKGSTIVDGNYSVAVNSYIASTYNFKHGEGEILKSTTTKFIIKYIKKYKNIIPCKDKRVKASDMK